MERPRAVTSHQSSSTVSRERLSDADQWDTLTSALNELGIVHVAPVRRRRLPSSLTVRTLFGQLFQACDSRIQQASIFLLLTYPDLASDAQLAIDELTGVTRDRAIRRYVAAASMQRMAKTRIAMQLGSRPDIPPAFHAELLLPPLDLEYGKAALIELARQEEARYGYDAWGTYSSLLELFLAESRSASWGHASTRGERLLCANELTAAV